MAPAIRTLCSLPALAALLAGGSAHADGVAKQVEIAGDPPPAEAVDAPRSRAWETAKATRRSGFVVGFTLGAGVASIAGFPNDAKKVGRERYYTETGARPGGMGTLWIGGALADWFTFGLGLTNGRLFATDGSSASTGGFVFHIDVFPLFPLGGRLRDLGVMLNAGTGSVTVVQNDTEAKLVDGGATSLIGGGVFWEGVRFWKFAGGPFFAANYMWSNSARRPGAFVGWRQVLYTGP